MALTLTGDLAGCTPFSRNGCVAGGSRSSFFLRFRGGQRQSALWVTRHRRSVGVWSRMIDFPKVEFDMRPLRVFSTKNAHTY